MPGTGEDGFGTIQPDFDPSTRLGCGDERLTSTEINGIQRTIRKLLSNGDVVPLDIEEFKPEGDRK